MITSLNHIGIAVKSLKQMSDLCTLVFKVHFPTPKEGKDFTASWVQLGNTTIEFMEPVASDGVIAKFLKKRSEGIHHLCYEVDDIESEVESYVAQGLELVKPGIRGNPGWITAFFHPKSTAGVLIELVQTRVT